MTTALISALIFLDAIILFVVFRLSKKKNEATPDLRDLTEERRYITELRTSIQEDLEHVQAQSKDVLNKVSKIAAEAEMEVKSGGDSIAKELESVVDQLSRRFEDPLKELTAKQSAVERLLMKLEKEKQSLTKLIDRSEQIFAFFNDKVPYQDILEDLQDKKYRDARHMLAKGYKAEAIAKELNLTKAEVELIAGVG